MEPRGGFYLVGHAVRDCPQAEHCELPVAFLSVTCLDVLSETQYFHTTTSFEGQSCQ